MKVYASRGSTASQRVLACLAEKGLEYELVPINMGIGQHKRQPYISLNPFGQVPALEDGDLKLFESRAINQYISTTYPDHGTELIYKDPKKRAIMTVWTEVESQKFDPAASKLAWELALKPIFGRTPDEAVVAEHEEKLGKVLDIYEARLAQTKYLGGDTFTLADLHHLPNMKYLFGTKAKRLFDARPHVRAWCAAIMSRPAWITAISVQ